MGVIKFEPFICNGINCCESNPVPVQEPVKQEFGVFTSGSKIQYSTSLLPIRPGVLQTGLLHHSPFHLEQLETNAYLLNQWFHRFGPPELARSHLCSIGFGTLDVHRLSLADLILSDISAWRVFHSGGDYRELWLALSQKKTIWVCLVCRGFWLTIRSFFCGNWGNGFWACKC